MHASETDNVAASEDVSSASDTESENESRPDDIALTEEWARELLSAIGANDAHDISVESRSGVAGALSRVLAVTLHYESTGEKRSLPVVVKLPPRDPYGRLFVAEAQFDSREILFYTEVAPTLNRLAKDALGDDAVLPIPKCIKARLPEEIGGDSELVLEDATSAGFEPADFAEGLNENRARAALYAAARLHALSLGLREQAGPLDTQFNFLFPCERAAAGYLRLIKRGLPQLESFLKSRPDCTEEAAEVSALSARAPSLLSTLLRPTEPSPLAHADFWSGNLLFRERDGQTECIALDWQMVSLGRPMDDVALLLLSSLSPENRRQLGDKLIEDYGDRLEYECSKLGASKVGAEIRHSLKSDWPRAALRALLLCAGSVDVALGDPRAERRLLEAVRDLHSKGVFNIQPELEV